MTKANKKLRIPFWMQITAILLAGVLASAAVWASGNRKADLPRYTVTFAYQDGTIIDTREVTEGRGVCPPEIPCEGVFRGWSGAINMVTGNVEVHPMIYDFAVDNFFYFHSVYVEEGTDFSLDVLLGGNVAVSSGELTMLYDPEVMEYLGCQNAAHCTITEAAEGELKISFNCAETLREAMTLVKLNFHALEKDAYATEVILQAKEMKIVTNGEEVPADCATINNKVYFLQEVEP